MLAVILSHAPVGMDGFIVSVEVDIRSGIPGIDIVGLPDGAVRESRDRVRVAIRNSGYTFPTEKILVSLAPAGLRKEGASYDLAVALGVLMASDQIGAAVPGKAMVLGELNLSGRVRPVNGVLPAVGTGFARGIESFLVPRENLREARALGSGSVHGISSLKEAAEALMRAEKGEPPVDAPPAVRPDSWGGRAHRASCDPGIHDAGAAHVMDISQIRGHAHLKRSLEIAAAGAHHILLFGPPGSGKTLGARSLPSLLLPLTREEALEVTRIHSIAGVLPAEAGLITSPPFRVPHHTASGEGLIGGGKMLKPGEVSLAHRGVLFLDEAPEFGMSLLQNLREPIEEGSVSIVRAGASAAYPAEFQLIMAFNPCPCGNMGRDSHACICSPTEIQRYWRRVGGALLDRVDIRVPLGPVSAEEMARPADPAEGSRARERVARAIGAQRRRYEGLGHSRNSRIPVSLIDSICPLGPEETGILTEAGRKLSISSRAYHSILRIARTIADLEGAAEIREEHLMEAVECRRYGDGDFYWSRS